MKLYKQTNNDYTLRTSSGKVYQLTIFSATKPQKLNVKYITSSPGYVCMGTLLKNIPDFLKSAVFKLNKND